MGVADDQVSSPTFALQNVYQGVVTVDHFDFYRIQTDEELFELGFEEMLDQQEETGTSKRRRMFGIM